MDSTEPIDLTNDTDVSVTSHSQPGDGPSNSDRQRRKKLRPLPKVDKVTDEVVILSDSDQDPNTPWIDKFLQTRQKRAPTDVQSPGSPAARRQLSQSSRPLPNNGRPSGITTTKASSSVEAKSHASSANNVVLPVERRSKKRDSNQSSTSVHSHAVTQPVREGAAVEQAKVSPPRRSRSSLPHKANVSASRVPVSKTPPVNTPTTKAPTAKRKHRESDAEEPKISKRRQLNGSALAASSSFASQTTLGRTSSERDDTGQQRRGSAIRTPRSLTATEDGLVTKALPARQSQAPSELASGSTSDAPRRPENKQRSGSSTDAADRNRTQQALTARESPVRRTIKSVVPSSLSKSYVGDAENPPLQQIAQHGKTSVPSDDASPTRVSRPYDFMRESLPAIPDTEPSLNTGLEQASLSPRLFQDEQPSPTASRMYLGKFHNPPDTMGEEPANIPHVRRGQGIVGHERATPEERDAAVAPSVTLLPGNLMDEDSLHDQNHSGELEMPETRIDEAVIKTREIGGAMSLRSTRHRPSKTGGLSTPRSHSEGPSNSPKDKSPSVNLGHGRAEHELRAIARQTSSSIDKNDARDLPLDTMTPMSEGYDVSTMSGMLIELKRFFNEYRDDSRYLAVTYLSRARSLVIEKRMNAEPNHTSHQEHIQVNGFEGARHPISPFKHMKGLQTHLEGRPPNNAVALSLEEPDATGKKLKVAVKHVQALTTTWIDDEEEVPAYSHCINLRNNVLGYNQKQLLYQPYFGEKAQDEVYDQLTGFDSDSSARRTTLLHGEQSRMIREYVLPFLERIGCPESAILYYLLRPDLTGAEAAAREPSCKEVFDRNALRWQRVFSKLPHPTNEELSKAALSCASFLRLTDYSLWHVVRKSPLCALDEEVGQKKLVDSIQSLACRVCHKHDCTQHGVRRESDNGSGSDHDADLTTVEKLDIDWPPKINFKRNLCDPAAAEKVPTERLEIVAKNVMRSSKGYQAVVQEVKAEKAHKRARFFPCRHPGQSCAAPYCSCASEGVFCEKACVCAQGCKRRYPGCDCHQFKPPKQTCLDDRCECFKLDRECDPDLCGSCGASVALDPENRGLDPNQHEYCSNVRIQLGTPARTILGQSRIHGFGLYAGEPLKSGQFIGEYRGELILEGERERRATIYDVRDSSYLFELTKDQDADAESFGNKMRYINHPPEEGRKEICNVYPRIMLCNMTPRIGMYANLNIPLGQELCFNYGPSYHKKLVGGKRTTKADAPGIRHSSPVESVGELAQTAFHRSGLAANSSWFIPPPDDDDEMFNPTDHGEAEYDEDDEDDGEEIVPTAQNRRGRPRSLGNMLDD